MTNTVLNFKKNKPKIICFHVNYSGSYHMMQPVISDLQDDKEKLNVILIVKGKDLFLEQQYEIKYYPTLLLIWKDEVVARFQGLVNRVELYDRLNELYSTIEKNVISDGNQ